MSNSISSSSSSHSLSGSSSSTLVNELLSREILNQASQGNRVIEVLGSDVQDGLVRNTQISDSACNKLQKADAEFVQNRDKLCKQINDLWIAKNNGDNWDQAADNRLGSLIDYLQFLEKDYESRRKQLVESAQMQLDISRTSNENNQRIVINLADTAAHVQLRQLEVSTEERVLVERVETSDRKKNKTPISNQAPAPLHFEFLKFSNPKENIRSILQERKGSSDQFIRDLNLGYQAIRDNFLNQLRLETPIWRFFEPTTGRYASLRHITVESALEGRLNHDQIGQLKDDFTQAKPLVFRKYNSLQELVLDLETLNLNINEFRRFCFFSFVLSEIKRFSLLEQRVSCIENFFKKYGNKQI